jgi:hypothetical protein
MKKKFLAKCENYSRLRESLMKLYKRRFRGGKGESASKKILFRAALWIDRLYDKPNSWPEMTVYFPKGIGDIVLFWYYMDVEVRLFVSDKDANNRLAYSLVGATTQFIPNPDIETVRETLWAKFPFKGIKSPGSMKTSKEAQ